MSILAVASDAPCRSPEPGHPYGVSGVAEVRAIVDHAGRSLYC